MPRPCLRPACEPLGPRLAPGSGGLMAPYAGPDVVYDRSSPEYKAFLASSASDYEIEASAYYLRIEQFPPPLPAVTAPPDLGPRMLIQDILRTYEAYLRDSAGP